VAASNWWKFCELRGDWKAMVRGGCSISIQVPDWDSTARVVVAARLPRRARSCAWLTSACGDRVSVSHDPDVQREVVQGLSSTRRKLAVD
jgi:hypothetical protein